MNVVGSATTSDEACRMCDELSPDVVLLDLDLGGRNGVDAIPRLTANGHTAVLVLTGIRNPDAQQEAVVAGARGVVPKEADAEAIIKAINKVYAGELWLDRLSTQKVLLSLANQSHSRTVSEADRAIASLTPREREIILALTTNAGAPAKQIASLLCISEHTLRNHLSSIYDKLGVSNRLGLYDFVQKRRLGFRASALG